MEPASRESRNRRTIALLLLIGIAPSELNGIYNPWLESRPGLFWAVEITTWIGLPAALYCHGLRRKLYTNAGAGFHWSLRGRRNVPGVITLLFLLPPVAFWWYKSGLDVSLRAFPVNYLQVPFNYQEMVPGRGRPFLRSLAIAHMAVTAGVVEETFYRGLFARLFREGWAGQFRYVLVSSLVFSSVHWEGGVVALLATFLFGLFAATFYAVAKNLWPLLLAHVFVDTVWLMQS